MQGRPGDGDHNTGQSATRADVDQPAIGGHVSQLGQECQAVENVPAPSLVPIANGGEVELLVGSQQQVKVTGQ